MASAGNVLLRCNSWHLPSYIQNNHLRYSLVLSSFNQWFGVQLSNQSLWNSTLGRQAVVFPVYINWGGNKSPLRVPHTTAVICCLSPNRMSSILLAPFWAIVHCYPGTIFIGVWSQVRTNSSRILSIFTTTNTSPVLLFLQNHAPLALLLRNLFSLQNSSYKELILPNWVLGIKDHHILKVSLHQTFTQQLFQLL